MDFSEYIRGRTEHFTGREWVFDAIEEWLERGTNRTFLLAGGPGTGKSAIAAQLVRIACGHVVTARYPTLRGGALKYYHFCQAALESTLSPLSFVAALSESLANRYPVFRAALESSGSRQIVINAVQNVSSAVNVVGAQITLEIKGGDARPLFDQIVRRPLQELCRTSPTEQIVILVDSLDEALLFDSETNIVQLLKLARDFPAQVRFVVTCRSNTERVFDVLVKPALDLLVDAPAHSEEVRSYALGRLSHLALPVRDALAARIAHASKGNFLYAHHVLNDVVQSKAGAGPNALELPETLEGVYRQFLERQLAAQRQRWNDVYRPLLGTIAVARGPGLTRQQLIGVTELADDTASDVLEACSQYLTGGKEPDAPYHIYHHSFLEFLFTDKNFGVYPVERHAGIARYLQELYGANWGRCQDDYALRYAPVHWAEAAVGTDQRSEARTQSLIDLTSNAKYQRQFERRIGDLPLLVQHLEGAVRSAASKSHEGLLPLLLHALKALASFRAEYLGGESVVALADAGKLELAKHRLALFDHLGDEWQTAARLILAWLGAEKDLDAARALRSSVTDDQATGLPLVLLRDRLDAALQGQPSFPADIRSGVPVVIGHEVVRRVSGQEFDQELLGSINPSLIASFSTYSDLVHGRGYAAEFDAPLLVHIEREHGVAGLVDQYVDAHAGYNYIEYRNRSLWVVLQAILRHHDDQAWVRGRIGKLLSVALAGGGVDFEEMTPLAATALLERKHHPGAGPTLSRARDAALAAADLLQEDRGSSDTWGNHKRRLAGLAELYALVAGDANESRRLLERIGISLTNGPVTGPRLPYGFAGFQAPATLRLADALRATGFDSGPLLETVCDSALKAAHNVQDYHFLARVTARCNALTLWHRRALSGPQLAQQVRELARDSAAAAFSSVHIVQDPYRHRRDGDPMTLPIDRVRQAETLEQLMEVFQRPALDFRRLNPEFELDQPIPPGTSVRIPDPGLAPLLAIHLAARCLAHPDLRDARADQIRSLVPVAMRNATAVDVVFSYLLIAAEIDDPELLEDIAQAAGPVNLTNPAAPVGDLGPS